MPETTELEIDSIVKNKASGYTSMFGENKIHIVDSFLCKNHDVDSFTGKNHDVDSFPGSYQYLWWQARGS